MLSTSQTIRIPWRTSQSSVFFSKKLKIFKIFSSWASPLCPQLAFNFFQLPSKLETCGLNGKTQLGSHTNSAEVQNWPHSGQRDCFRAYWSLVIHGDDSMMNLSLSTPTLCWHCFRASQIVTRSHKNSLRFPNWLLCADTIQVMAVTIVFTVSL